MQDSLGNGSLAACLLKFPFMTWKIMAGDHWEALKLWRKRSKVPQEPSPAQADQLP